MIFPDKAEYKIEYSDEIVSFIKGLLTKERAYRLGNNGGAQEVLEHLFLRSMYVSSSKIPSPLESLGLPGLLSEELDSH